MSHSYKRSRIYKTLRNLDLRFEGLSNRKKATQKTSEDMELCAKAAVIELGGWIEVSVDEVLINYTTRKIADPDELKRIRKDVIDKVYGFDYTRNFRPLMERILGIDLYNRMINPYAQDGRLQRLQAELSTIKPHRNTAAHTNWTGATKNFEAPSVIINRLRTIYPILMSMFEFIDKS